ncbi:MAG: hypothetical protein E6H62_09415 [Betaproteobacteria bacterium]|nr:MAG: hypothetical protein E6H61_09450 [Betaproteobacteria bacterium]TMH54286.1 MAG: hypothetical protein E6H62_09415 [Betaproteobacteria bacterium]
MIRIVSILCGISALAGCADFSAPGAGSGGSGAPWGRENRESRQVIELIAYTQRVAALQADEQQRELNASTQMLSKDRGAYGRVRVALLLALPGTAFNDDTRAASLLESLAGAGASESPPGPMQQFAGLLHAQISERLREQRRTVQLKEQLEALKAVERNIIEREQARPR